MKSHGKGKDERKLQFSGRKLVLFTQPHDLNKYEDDEGYAAQLHSLSLPSSLLIKYLKMETVGLIAKVLWREWGGVGVGAHAQVNLKTGHFSKLCFTI